MWETHVLSGFWIVMRLSGKMKRHIYIYIRWWYDEYVSFGQLRNVFNVLFHSSSLSRVESCQVKQFISLTIECIYINILSFYVSLRSDSFAKHNYISQYCSWSVWRFDRLIKQRQRNDYTTTIPTDVTMSNKVWWFPSHLYKNCTEKIHLLFLFVWTEWISSIYTREPESS